MSYVLFFPLRFNIHHNTLWLKTEQARGQVNRSAKKVGRQAVFTEEEEQWFIAHAMPMSSFGFPMTKFDLRCVVKAYLDRTGSVGFQKWQLSWKGVGKLFHETSQRYYF